MSSENPETFNEIVCVAPVGQRPLSIMTDSVPPSLFSIFMAIFQYFDGHFSILIFLTSVTSNSRMCKLSLSPKDLVFFKLHSSVN